jgi:hypothetical protein
MTSLLFLNNFFFSPSTTTTSHHHYSQLLHTSSIFLLLLFCCCRLGETFRIVLILASQPDWRSTLKMTSQIGQPRHKKKYYCSNWSNIFYFFQYCICVFRKLDTIAEIKFSGQNQQYEKKSFCTTRIS